LAKHALPSSDDADGPEGIPDYVPHDNLRNLQNEPTERRKDILGISAIGATLIAAIMNPVIAHFIQPTTPINCAEARTEAIDSAMKYPTVTELYTGDQEAQCHLNEVVDQARAGLRPSPTPIPPSPTRMPSPSPTPTPPPPTPIPPPPTR
jgi:hypothetical protein